MRNSSEERSSLVNLCLLGPRYSRLHLAPCAGTKLFVLSIIWNINNIRGTSYLYQIVARWLRILRFAILVSQSLSGLRY